MARLCTLASGSSGNAVYIASSRGGILIDAGISNRSLTAALASLDASPREIEAVYVTHEHIDHIRGLRLFLQKSGAKLYASGAVLDYLAEHDFLPPCADPTELFPGEHSESVGIDVLPFSTPHDSVGSLGYRLTLPDGLVFGVATDLGHVTAEIRAGLCGCDLVVQEANYDRDTLWHNSAYPYPLKQRIDSPRGHLCNDDSARLAAELIASGTSRIVLGHLSAENNSPSLAHNAVSAELTRAGVLEGRDYLLYTAPRSERGALFRL